MPPQTGKKAQAFTHSLESKTALGLLDAYAARYAQGLTKAASQEAVVGGIAPGAAAFFAAAVFRQAQSSVLFVCPSNREAEKLARESALFCSESYPLKASQILFFPAYENLPYSEGGIHLDCIAQRIRCLDQIISNAEPRLLFCSSDALLRKLPKSKALYELAVSLSKEQEYAPLKLLKDLTALGYTRTERVEAPGEICQKGSILDLYPVNFSRPIRIDYFDDLIETIAFFDVESQRTGETLELKDPNSSLSILPCGELVLNTKQSQELFKKLRQNTKAKQKLPLWAQHEQLWHGHTNTDILSQWHYPGLEFLFPLVSESCSLLDYFTEPLQIYLYPGLEVKESFARIRREFTKLYEQKKTEQFCLPPEDLLYDPLASLTKKKQGLQKKQGKQEEQEEYEKQGSKAKPSRQGFPHLIEVNPYGQTPTGIQDTSSVRGKISELCPKIIELIENSHQVCISSPHQNQLRRIAGFFQNENNIRIQYCDSIAELPPKADRQTLYLLCSPKEQGFSIPELQFYLLSDSELFGRTYQRRIRTKRSGSSPIESFLDLKEGSYVVHLIHGIGRFIGLEKVKTMNKERDFLVLEYADRDKLYVPLDQISMVQQYAAPTEKPRLDSLGKASFKKVKAKVQKKIEELAAELLRLQALRSSRKGCQFPPDSPWQEDFEANFPYEETPDQLTAIEAVKADMQKAQPMDRLVCGDVGYGKTEIAIRAAFKAAVAGRQAAFLAPTTILAWQHYKNLKARFQNYPISVDWISRFRTASETTQVKKALQMGKLDIVVGTHALLSEKIQIKNLGLLIVDEEQRFGVSHKEAIKRLRNLVDVITLTATPIPRTLHMSLAGIRDLSIIESPPKERLPIESYVMEERDSIISQAILREKERQGQVFYLHNRIASIERAAERIMKLVPQASLAVLHGRMNEEEIEDTLLAFQEQRFDILVTTSIIENGIDIPNVNTLIVDQAELFGLSQLYQIRGRVGRSHRQAYAYFLYPPQSALSEASQKRLNTILEYQELGSGFKVAMRDLEIRGAGNILGREQSGHIIELGYELYIKLLQQAIQELRGEKIEVEQSCAMHLHTDFFIPEEYITDVRQRIEFYKRFEAAKEESEIEELCTEMEERFGPMDSITEIFVKTERLRSLAQRAGFISIQRAAPNKYEFRIGDNFRIEPQNLIRCIQENPGLSVRAAQKDTLFYQIQGQSASLGNLDNSLGNSIDDPINELSAVTRQLLDQARAEKMKKGSKKVKQVKTTLKV